MSIVTPTDFKSYFRNEIQGDDTFVTAVLNATDQGIFEYCQRRFEVAGSASARTYVPRPCSPILRVHDCTTITSVVENGVTLTANTGFVNEPVMQTSWAGETRPFEQIRRRGAHWYTDDGLGTVVVTATWGWLAIPSMITEAAYIGAKDLLEAREIKFGIADIGQWGPMRVRQNALVQQLCAPYRRVEAFGIA